MNLHNTHPSPSIGRKLMSFALTVLAGSSCVDGSMNGTAGPSTNNTLCQPTQSPLAPFPESQEPAARIYWDVSKSMKAFAAKGGPLESLNRKLESSALQGIGVNHFSHVLVADTAVEVGSLPQPLAFKGAWTNLPEVAQQAAATLSDTSAPHLSIIISDMHVETPPALRRQPHATVCGDISLPSDVEAPYVFGACFAKGLQPTSSLKNSYVGVIRAPQGERTLFIIIISREAALGAKALKSIRDLLPAEVTSAVLVDLSQREDKLTVGPCRFDPGQDDVLLMGRSEHGALPPCRFRFRTKTASHNLNCAVTMSADSSAAVSTELYGIHRGDDALDFDNTKGIYALVTTPNTPTMNVELRPTVRGALPEDALANVRSFAGDSSAADALAGLVRALTILPHPDTVSWQVRYQGGQ
jgi:hypothetical protein